MPKMVQQDFKLDAPSEGLAPVSPLLEMGAYEQLWQEQGATFKSIDAKLKARPGAVPSDFVPEEIAESNASYVRQRFAKANIERFGVRVHATGDYPQKLCDARYPVHLLYYLGWWDLVYSRSIAIVGTRNPSEEGMKRTRQLVRKLVADDFTIVSGLAQGIDTVAHNTALAEGGRTIAVLGTPLSKAYPATNAKLQQRIAKAFLVISQVPLKRWEAQGPKVNRIFFPERNVTMSALTEATVIVEAGETSGTLVQARAALEQGRKLFILDSCFNNPSLTWPHTFAERGAVRVKTYDDIKEHLPNPVH